MRIHRILLSSALASGIFTAAMPALAQDWIVKFRPGDSLWNLCIEYSNIHGCWIELGKYNNISDAKTLRPGDEIRFPKAWLATMPVVGQVKSVQGEVFYTEKPRGAQTALVAGQSLLLGSRIVTRQGTAQIALGNYSALLIRPHSELNLDTFSTGESAGQAAEISLDAGDVEVEVDPGSKSRFEIKTPAAIAAVRGTRYRVSSLSASSASTRSEVLEGAVEVSGVGATLVPAGFGLIAREGQTPDEPKKLLPPPPIQQTRIDAPLPIKVNWQANPGAVSWKLDLLLGEEGDELFASYALSEPEISLTELSEACYRMVLRGIDAEGFNGLEAQVPVCVVPKLPATAKISISTVERTRRRISWSAVPDAVQYRLEVASDSSFENLIASQIVTQPNAEVEINEVGRYRVRVTAIDKDANMGQPRHTSGYVLHEYFVPGTALGIILLLVLL